MGRIPPWALAAGSLLGLNELVAKPAASMYGLYKGIRKDQADAANLAAGSEVMGDYGRVTGPEDVKFIKSTSSTYGMNDPETIYKTQKYGDDLLDAYKKKADEDAVIKDMSTFAKNVQSSGLPVDQYVAQNFDKVPWAAMEKFDKGYQNIANSVRQAATAGEKKTKESNISGFQSAIGGLTGPSTSPVDLNKYMKTGGYAPFNNVESDIRQAAGAYNVGDSDEVNKAISRAQETYKNTLLPTESGKVGRTTFTGQRNLFGDFRKDVQDKAPVVKVDVGDKPKKSIFYSKDGKNLVVDRNDPVAVKAANDAGFYAQKPTALDAALAGSSAALPDLDTAKKMVKKYGSPEAARKAWSEGKR